MQQILAFETDLLEFDDLFDGNPAVDRKVAELKDGALAELAQIDAMGGAVGAIDHMKARLVEANADRIAGIEGGDTAVIGGEPLYPGRTVPSGRRTRGRHGSPTPMRKPIRSGGCRRGRNTRDGAAVETALADLREAARSGANIMPPSIAAARAGVTTGVNGGDMIRQAFGQISRPHRRCHRTIEPRRGAGRYPGQRRYRVGEAGPAIVLHDGQAGAGRPFQRRRTNCRPRPAIAAWPISYDGIRLTPDDIVARVAETRPHVLGLSILSGSHVPLVEEIVIRLEKAGFGDLPVVVGGIIPERDAAALKESGIAEIYTPKDFQLNLIMEDIVKLAVN